MAPAIVVRQLDGLIQGWSVAESANFRIFHHGFPDLATEAAQVAERTRIAVSRKWLGRSGLDWNPRCDLYLHVTGPDYSQATGVPPQVPGHSTIRTDGSRVVSRRVDLHHDLKDTFQTILPHEVTHVVLAGQFGDKPTPPWVNEGVAVLGEPREMVERHLQQLPRYGRQGSLFRVRVLVQLEDYPEPRLLGPFYAQSVSLVEFLANEKGPQVFTRFVQDSRRDGYEPALRQHYGWDFDDLEQRWRQHAFAERPDKAQSSRAERR